MAEWPGPPLWSASLLAMAKTWLQLSVMAESQDANPLSSTYRIRGH
jgi:hypothetical protein